MVPTVRIRLAKHEAGRLMEYFHFSIHGKINNPNVNNDLIVMAEFYDKFVLKVFKQTQLDKSKPVLYQLPLSVARILHYQILAYCPNEYLQRILCSLDLELTNLGMKPIEKFSLT